MAQKEYLKMADVFADPSNTEVMSIGSAQIKPEFDDVVTAFDYAAHAINSHDELVDEVERLRGALYFVNRQVCALELSMKSNSEDSGFHGELLTNIRCVSA